MEVRAAPAALTEVAGTTAHVEMVALKVGEAVLVRRALAKQAPAPLVPVGSDFTTRKLQ